MKHFNRSKSVVVKEVFESLLLGGMIMIAATSPYFLINICRNYQKRKKFSKEKVYDAFSYLKRSGYLKIEEKNNQIYISLTEKGKEKAGRFQIDNLKIGIPQKWDKKWRLILFDVVELKKIHREALRGKLKELGFRLLQKSVWVVPWECEKEINLLREFFGLSENDLRMVVCEKIGPEDDFKRYFKL